MLNAQKQRQDRYIIPAYPLMSAGLVMAPSIVTAAAMPFLWHVTRENNRVFNSNTPAPAQRDYSHDVATPAETYPLPHEAYWPISHDLIPWKLDSALEKIAAVQGIDGTVGFLLDEQGGAPGYGIVLSKAVQMGFNWHIATIMIARRGGPGVAACSRMHFHSVKKQAPIHTGSPPGIHQASTGDHIFSSNAPRDAHRIKC